MNEDLMNASTTTSPIVEVYAVSCSKCGYHADVPDLDQPATTPRSNLHDNTWEHVGCGGQISFVTEPQKPLTVARLDDLLSRLASGEPIRSGFDGDVIDQLRVHYGPTPQVPEG